MKKNKISYRCNLNNNHYKTKVPQHKSESIYIYINKVLQFRTTYLNEIESTTTTTKKTY